LLPPGKLINYSSKLFCFMIEMPILTYVKGVLRLLPDVVEQKRSRKPRPLPSETMPGCWVF
jgi:hypothetical protein